ncbi:hypothetical protein IGK47_003224 [Enterococcus sp. AZ007]
MMAKFLQNRFFPFFLIFNIALLFTLPQIISGGMIIGSDAIFHFNRFYDTAMQIKNGNIHYFLTTFGFQQTGRIINPFYGPLMAYVQGLLVIISGSWFRYQILSNFILYFISGVSMFTLLKSNKVTLKVNLFTSILFMTTYSVHYWTIGQCFSSWGAVFLPFALIPLRKMVLEGKVAIVQIGFSVALMMQIHLFSCLLLILIYFIFFIYSWWKSQHKIQMIRDITLSVLLFSLLTANIWMNMLHLYSTNEILPPFINKSLDSNTINRSSWYWLVNPISLVPIIICQFKCLFGRQQKLSQINKMASITALLFLILSSSFIPWKFLMSKEIKIVELIQFPFRFFIPFTVLILFSFALSLEENSLQRKAYSKYRQPVILLSLVQVLLTISYALSLWLLNDIHYFESLHTHIQPIDSQVIKDSFHQNDLAKGLSYWEKSTPDYLPLYQKTEQNKYQLYEKLILEQHRQFEKKSCKEGLRIEWTSQGKETTNLPIILYQNSQLIVNGQEISPQKAALSTIGTPTIKQVSGKNYAILTYKAPSYFTCSLRLTLISWLILCLYAVFSIIKSSSGGHFF